VQLRSKARIFKGKEAAKPFPALPSCLPLDKHLVTTLANNS
jgi:hypothetical protein